MPAYNVVLFDPPAPVAQVKLRNFHNGLFLDDVQMLLDTGADVTLIPKSAIEQMNVSIIPDKQYELVSFDGEVHIAFVVELEMIIFDKTLRGRFIPVDQTWGILGRNVLNLFPLLLDGPHGNWEVQPDPIL